MKRSLLAVAAVLALGSASAYAQTAGFPQPSFKDYTDLPAITITGTQTVDQKRPKGSMDSGGPRGPSTVIVQPNDRTTAKYASAPFVSDAGPIHYGNGTYPTLNDTFNYPAY
jgi:hypothetical protein